MPRFLLPFLLAALLAVCACPESRTKEVVARINGRPIYLADFKEQLERNWMIKTASLKQLDYRLKYKCMEDLITQELIIQESRRIGVAVSSRELQAEINKMVEPNNPEFKKSLENSGTSEQKWTAQVKNDLLIKKTADLALKYQFEITEQEVQSYYEGHRQSLVAPQQFRIRQIMVGKEETAKDILNQLAQGADFQELARKYSESPEAKKGGDLGWVEIKQLPLALQAQAVKLAPGGISSPTKSAFGYHILMVENINKFAELSLAEARPQIIKIIEDQKRSRLFQAWVQTLLLRNKDHIKINHQVL